jgi:hypothetical protein
VAKWLTRWSAKPVFEGSIPSRCSNYLSRFCAQDPNSLRVPFLHQRKLQIAALRWVRMKKIVKDANKWSITTRGFGERYPDKTLVLLDGRTLNWKVSSNTTGERTRSG